MTTLAEDRYTAIHLLRAGHSTTEVAKQLKRTARWVRKWHRRFPGGLERAGGAFPGSSYFWRPPAGAPSASRGAGPQ